MGFWRKALCVAAVITGGCATVGQAPRPADIAVENVTVIDPGTGRVLPRRNVYVAAGRVVAVLPATARKRFVATAVVDGSGRFLIPGLIDMHSHLFLPEPAEPSLNLLLANGVTGIREMSSDCWAAAGAKTGCIEEYRILRAKVRSGEMPGPDLLALTSTMVMGPTRLKLPKDAPSFITPVNEADARQLVGHLAARGVDLIKTHDSIPTEAFFTMMEEANRLGVGVAGHVPFGAGSLGAATRGYRSIEHARDLLYDCSRFGPELRRREAAFAEGRAGAARIPNMERLRRTVAEFDPAGCDEFLRKLAATGIYYVPTHVTREMEARVGEPAYRNDPARKYVLPERIKGWEADLTETAALPAEEQAALADFFRHGLRITGMAHRAGVPIMAGTDLNDTMIVPGFSLHRELGLLHSAGLTNMEVLRAATTTPARYLGRTDLGGVSPGMRADLVLLSADPIADIGNTRSVEAVIAAGRLYRRSDLDALLAEVERMAATR